MKRGNPINSQYNSLFQPITLPNGAILKDRLGVAPMTTYSGNPDGTVSESELTYYKRRSNIGDLYISACIAISENGIAFPNQFIGFDDRVMPSLKDLASHMKANGSKAIVQMQHGGRHGQPELITTNETVAPSAVTTPNSPVAPRELTSEEIHSIIRDFGETTKRVIEAGFDGVEIHGANHYLLQQFVSSYFNRREDEWGGTLQNRLKFSLAVLKEVQETAAKYADDSFIIGYRVSPEEIHGETVGYTLAETKVLVDLLIGEGVHYIHTSLFDFKTPPAGINQEGSIVSILSDHINGRVPLVVVGSVKTPQDALEALQEGADIVAMGRQALIDPEWTEKVKAGSEDEIFTAIPKARVGKLDIPESMWNMITSYGMVQVAEE
ncbi:2,4-dienoyl-CoA reductase-like NADH-dependent reductase (Old Yellow Enzyme family) [Planomicrobium soli]|uniref:2,4-dienoyl-CoA reductase-like NADH-dependent reductase (Old Yellow Enzyme family) n=1 Tax=Planomicrobium soli TaxID=1176648 RepID=A0A2P8H5E5_9BACL|nr:NADH-dependent flavin oxidoreductase [Planomicrobium soli]PSL41414.1 2,4-dienoyl-CoA reductase-like NADH-dependent reductase (Old Yellow Enzyme family) [Planomicrobium soli]